MFDGIDATGWLVIACALALGFGMVRFMIVTSRERDAERPPEAERAADETAPPPDAPPR